MELLYDPRIADKVIVHKKVIYKIIIPKTLNVFLEIVLSKSVCTIP